MVVDMARMAVGRMKDLSGDGLLMGAVVMRMELGFARRENMAYMLSKGCWNQVREIHFMSLDALLRF